MKKKIIIISSVVVGILALLFGSFLIYAAMDYNADDVARAVLEQDNVIVEKDLTIVQGDIEEVGIIFYPGAKVEAIAYLPILAKIADAGYSCYLVEMPFNMAIFDSNAADKVMEEHQEITTWYIMGHSMGGAMASRYASANKDKVAGLILLAAYIYGDYSPRDTLTIYGSLNTSVGDKITYEENIVVIEGGNHAQFGNYGFQKGDEVATITREQQQAETVLAIVNFLASRV